MTRFFASPTRRQGTPWHGRLSLLALREGLVCTALVLALACALWSRADDSPTKPETQPRLRRPIALALADAGRWLFTANRDSGTISVIDTVTARPVAEIAAGLKLVDLAITPDCNQLLAVDENAAELVILSRK